MNSIIMVFYVTLEKVLTFQKWKAKIFSLSLISVIEHAFLINQYASQGTIHSFINVMTID